MGKPKERKHLEDLDVDVIILKLTKNWDAAVDWIYLAQDKNRAPALVNAVMQFRAPKNAGLS